jgi:glycosyltransferase involved in cell wall biosynthesis
MVGMDVYVNSSLSEGLSQSVLEAMSLELPLIVTDVGDHAAVVGGSDGVCGLVVPPAQPDALAGAMVLMATDADWRRSCGRNGLSRHTARFSLKSMISGYEKFLDSVAAQVPSSGS